MFYNTISMNRKYGWRSEKALVKTHAILSNTN